MTPPIYSQEKISLEEFLKLPETQPASEYIEGCIYQKPIPQGEHNALQARVSRAINRVGIPQKNAYGLTELRCTFGGGSVVSDIAVFEWQRIPLRPDSRIANRVEIAPDWTIEILCSGQSPNRIIKKISFCLKHGTKLSWFIDPEDESISVFQSDRLPEVKSDADTLPVLSALGDWQLSVSDLFDWVSLT
jgi:Uma2 family endonuclease